MKRALFLLLLVLTPLVAAGQTGSTYYATVTRNSTVKDELLLVYNPTSSTINLRPKRIIISSTVNTHAQVVTLIPLNLGNQCVPITIEGVDAETATQSRAVSACQFGARKIFHNYYLSARQPVVIDVSDFRFTPAERGIGINLPVATNGNVSVTIVWSETIE